MKSMIPFLLAAALAVPACAQASGFSVNGAVILGLDGLTKATHRTTGLTLGADYEAILGSTDIPGRIGLSVADLPGNEKYGLKTSFVLYQLHGDILLSTWTPRLRWLLGCSANVYSMSRTGTENLDDPYDIDHHYPVRDAKGLKLGLRAGLTYAFTPRVSGELLFQQTEMAGKDLGDPYIRQGGVNPAWFQAGASYRF